MANRYLIGAHLLGLKVNPFGGGGSLTAIAPAPHPATVAPTNLAAALHAITTATTPSSLASAVHAANALTPPAATSPAINWGTVAQAAATAPKPPAINWGTVAQAAAAVPKPKPPATPPPNPAAIARANNSANRLIAAGRKLQRKKGGSALGQAAIAAGQRSLSKAKSAGSPKNILMGVIGQNPFGGTAGITAVDPSAFLATQAGLDDAMAAMSETGGRALDIVNKLATSNPDVATAGQAIIDQMTFLYSAYSNNPSDTSIGPQAFALIQQENTWENTAAGLAGKTPGISVTPQDGPQAPAGGAPTISSISDVSNPSGNNPPTPSPYGGPVTGGANPGDSISITGTNFTGATSVLLGGASAQFSVVSATQINATVPQGAQTGPVQVTTPGGSATSSGVLYVNQAGAAYQDPNAGGGGSYGGGGGGGGGGDGGGGGGDPGDPGNIDWGDGASSQDGGGDGGSMPDDGGGMPDGGGDAGDPGNIDWGDGTSSDGGTSDGSTEETMIGNRYIIGAVALGAKADFVGTWMEQSRGGTNLVTSLRGDHVGATAHPPFDNTQMYKVGDVVTYWGQYWQATRDVLPPMMPSIMKGDVPGGSDAWRSLSADEVVSNVLGSMIDQGARKILGAETIPTAGANYTDYKTVLAVQGALKAKGFDPKKLDGKMGPNTAKAIRAMQVSAGIPQTGVIDEGVIMALGVVPGVLPPGVTASAEADVKAQVALDAATAVEHAATPQDAQVASQQVVDAAPATPPELKQAAQAAHAAIAQARTPAALQAAKQQVQVAAQNIAAAQAPGWWSTPLWSGAPVKRWQGAVGVGAGIAVVSGLIMMARR